VSKDCVGLVWLANKDWAVAHPKERAAFIAGLQAGIEDERKDMQAAMDVEKKYLHFSAPLTDDFKMTLTDADLEFFQDQMMQVGFLKKKLDVATLKVQ
jgi:ABC-type nitrate/sulfonate/bicarbonate transport system substrate-binding protein